MSAKPPEWVGVFEAPAHCLLGALRAAMRSTSRKSTELSADAHNGAAIDTQRIIGADAIDAHDFGQFTVSQATALALVAFLSRCNRQPVAVARLANGAIKLSAASGWVVIDAPRERRPNPLHALQAEARQLGVTWSDVVSVANDIAERDSANDIDSMRRRAAHLLCIGGAWRSGLERLARTIRNNNQDVTNIPGSDTIAVDLRSEFEFLGARTTEDIFDMIFSDYQPPTRCDQLAEALGFIEANLTLCEAA